MALQIDDVLKRCDRVNSDDVSADGCKHVAPVAEGTLEEKKKNVSVLFTKGIFDLINTTSPLCSLAL